MMDGFIYFLGWTFLVIIVLTTLFILHTIISSREYCCKCGKSVSEDDLLYGGCTRYRCPKCDTALQVKELFEETYAFIPYRF